MCDSPPPRRRSPTLTWLPFASTTELTIGPTDGQYRIYAQLRDSAGLISPPLASHRLTLDTSPPTSVAGPLDPLHVTPAIEVPVTAADDRRLASVELWVRHRSTPLQPWGAWELGAVGDGSPFSYQAALGDGEYEFYTVAVDDAGNREAAPASADAATRVLLSDIP